MTGTTYKGLNTFRQNVFPKKCAKCGEVYANLEDFLARTQEIENSSGLKDYDIGQTIVALFRNCSCESTLTISCSDRRDLSEGGIKQREKFKR